jgi:hypothetical protein
MLLKIKAAEDLMMLTRELKELWLFGPLRKLYEGEQEANAQIEQDATRVAELADSLLVNDQEEGEEESESKSEGQIH